MSQLRYEPEDQCPVWVAIVSAVQIFLPNTIGVIMLATLVVQASGQSSEYLNWVVFASVASCGLGTILQALRLKYVGAGRVVVTNFNVPYLAVCALALDASGPRVLASLILVSTLLQLILTQYLASLRRVLTPTVNSIIVMLVAVSAVPFIVGHAVVPPEDTTVPLFLAPGVVALACGVLVSLRGSALLRMWILPIMVVTGVVVAVLMGFYDFDLVARTPLVSVPFGGWPGIDLGFGTEFWTLLPVFVIVNLTAFMKSVGDLSVIYRSSYRIPIAIDYRTVQGGLNVSGLSTVLSGLMGTPPVAVPWVVTVVYVNLIGVAARSVGMCLGLMTLAVAPFSKLMAVLIAIPSPVVSAVYIVIFGMLFIEGAKMTFARQVDQKKATVVGVSIVLGLSSGSLGGLVAGSPSLLLSSSIVVGGLAAIAMTVFSELPDFWSKRLRVELAESSLPAVEDFFSSFADKHAWTKEGKNRLCLVGEEVLLSLLAEVNDDDTDARCSADDQHQRRQMTANIRHEDDSASIEIIIASDGDMGGNLEDRLAYLEDEPTTEDEQHFSLHILRHYASSVDHRKYHGVDIISCRVHK